MVEPENGWPRVSHNIPRPKGKMRNPPPNPNKPMGRPLHKKPKHYFKKNFFGGMVLMIKHPHPIGCEWEKATEGEAQQYMKDIDKLKFYKDILDSVKETHPEALI